MDLVGAFHYGLVSIIFTFTIVELFDNIGTLIGVTKAAGLVDKDGKIEKLRQSSDDRFCWYLIISNHGYCAVTSYVESSAGVNVGGKTGLTAVVVGICFLLAFFFSPLASLIPAYATAPALIVVGASQMMKNVQGIDFTDFSESISAFLTVIKDANDLFYW